MLLEKLIDGLSLHYISLPFHGMVIIVILKNKITSNECDEMQ
jgi:hypothetical protein